MRMNKTVTIGSQQNNLKKTLDVQRMERVTYST